MATGIPARLTREEGRKFGLTVGVAFLAFSGLLGWRGRLLAALVFAAIGCVLVLAGLLIPTRLGPIHRAWMGLAHGLSRVTTPIFMGVVYFLVLTPTGWIMRRFGQNPIRHSLSEGSFWLRKTAEEDRRGKMEHQF
jgi:Saxitoxin biosynthesis operon protein SxtJ